MTRLRWFLPLVALGCAAGNAPPEILDVPEVFDVPIPPTDAATADAPDVVDVAAPDVVDVTATDVAMDAGCTASAQCSGATPVCDRGTGRCVACSASEDRCGPGMYCRDNACVAGCRDDGACGRDGGVSLRCDLTRRTCVVCRDDGDCPLGSLCRDGNACVPGCSATRGCPEGETCCGAQCQRTRSDPAHCGACNAACALASATATCAMGRCAVGACAAGSANCDALNENGCEVDTRVTVAHCGGCGNACPARANATPTCAAGACGFTCNAGFADCDMSPANGCEAVLASSAAHCGRCGNACPARANATPTCGNGACGFTCNAGFADCDGDAANGCEADLASTAHCGRCNNACAGATPLCTAAGGSVACTSGCAAGQLRCGSTCVDPATSVANCGSCGNACPARASATTTCAASTCGFTCNAGRGDCDGSAANGCETDTAVAVAHCGRCGNACPARANATPTCGNGACGYACNAGFADCDGSPGNGCEVNLNADPMHCGRCRAQCSGNNIPAPTCNMGVCGGACAAGTNDCNRDPADGCEVNLASDPSHCGACGTRCASGVCGTSLALPMGSTAPARWNLNGAARWDGATGSVALAPATRGQAGTAWYANPLAGDVFTVDFEFRIGGGSRADGLALALQRNGNNVIGRGGSGFGVAGLEGWAVEVDVYNNNTCMDANGNHVGVDTLAICDNAVGSPNPLAVSGDLPFDVVDNNWHPVSVVVDRGSVRVSVEGRMHINNVALPGLTSTTPYWIGFGAGTGDLAARHDVRNVRVVYPSPRCL